MKSNWILKKTFCELKAIGLADKCLLIFMIILMVQSGYNLIFHELTMEESSSFDIIVRTTAAAIFGYFISANFKNESKGTVQNRSVDAVEPIVFTTSLKNDSKTMGKIGFCTATDDDKFQHGYTNISEDSDLEQRDCLQIVVVTTIGLFSLLILIIAHNYFIASGVADATISQLRDFVSGSVGFLIGHSTKENKKK